MKHLPLLMYTTFCGLYSMQTEAADKKGERPNILWLTFEDTSAYEFGCYGNKGVHTPNADSLAARGIQFMNAWSVAPQSSAARSSLITGCYSSTYGMDIHPVPYDTPADIFFPQRLREAGYYCTNNSKTHYNSTTDNKSCWDECNNKASYNSPKRRKDQPFFAVFNTVTSHMGRIRTFHTDGRRDYTQEGIYPALLSLPSYVPDLPEVRSDYAGHLEAVQDVDTWLGFFMKDLKEKGLDENTIIFFFSDHGGCIPRGKGYLYESGLRVPLIVYFPPKWQHLANNATGKEYSLVNFTDLGPTVLSLSDIKPPKHMQGRALYGKFASREKRTMQFALAANQLHHFMPVRAVTFAVIFLIVSLLCAIITNGECLPIKHGTNWCWGDTIPIRIGNRLSRLIQRKCCSILKKIRMNCMTYPHLPNMWKPCSKCVKHYPSISVLLATWDFSFQIHALDTYFMKKCARRNILWTNFIHLWKLRERQL